jgi:hypothetical protein
LQASIVVVIACAGLWLAGGASITSAHEGGSMGVALVHGRLPPGAGVEIIGIDFSPEETIEVRLEGPDGRWVIGTLTAGPDGHFAVVLPLPTDMPAGLYQVDIASSAGITFREYLQVDPVAPTPGTTITPMAELLQSPASVGEDLAWQFAPLVVFGAAIGGLAFVWLRGRRRRGFRPTG